MGLAVSPSNIISELDVANRSHPGMVRAHNEDAIFVDRAGLAILADGMGGYNAGEVASGILRSLLGDPDQAIYHFRGASSAAFNEFVEVFRKLEQKNIVNLATLSARCRSAVHRHGVSRRE